MITTIIFDLSNVYLEGILGSHKYFEKKVGTPVSDTYFYNEDFKRFMLGQVTEDAYWRSVIKENSWDISIDELKTAARKNFTEIKGTREIIERLKKEGYTLLLLSNHAKEWVEYSEEKYQYHQLFDEVFYSFSLGIAKPHKDIFSTVLKRIAAEPTECLFIDDYKKNLEAAETFGIKTILFTTAGNLENELTNLKIVKRRKILR